MTHFGILPVYKVHVSKTHWATFVTTFRLTLFDLYGCSFDLAGPLAQQSLAGRALLLSKRPHTRDNAGELTHGLRLPVAVSIA